MMLNCLASIAKEVGKILLDQRDKCGKGGKWVGTQFKSDADKIAHRELKIRLEKLTPELFVISEEDTKSLLLKRPESYWLIDPLDGTASFAGGFSGFVTQIALMKNSRPELAAVYSPVSELLYTAEYRKGAYLNNKRLKLSKRMRLETMIDNYPQPRGVAKNLFREFKFGNYVECGSIGLKICRVADGSADLFMKDVVVRDWDIAAPYLVINEAGGNMTDINGKKIGFEGDYSHEGLVAASSSVTCDRIASWYKGYKKTEVK